MTTVIPAELFMLREYVPLAYASEIIKAYSDGGLRAAVAKVQHVGYELKKEAKVVLSGAEASKEARAAADTMTVNGQKLIEWAQAYRLAHPFAI